MGFVLLMGCPPCVGFIILVCLKKYSVDCKDSAGPTSHFSHSPSNLYSSSVEIAVKMCPKALFNVL